MSDSVIEWLQNWYLSQMDGDWEDSYGLKIRTLGNPGWSVEIDLADTDLADKPMAEIKEYLTDDDWYRVWLEDNKFQGRGDPDKLETILLRFRNWCEFQ